jgi:hypothetical protein
MNLTERGSSAFGRIKLAQDGVQWRALVNTVKNLRFPFKAEISWPDQQVSASDGGLCFTELVHR